MKLISFDTIKQLNIPYTVFYGWVEEMLKNKSSAILPPKISLKQKENCFYNIMPSVLPDMNVMGTKLVMRYPQNKPALTSQILLYRQSDGEPLALMDGTYITAMRTGAVAAHSVNTFAKNGFKTIGFAGLGNTARATLSIFAAECRDTPYNIGLLRYKDHTETFINRFKEHKNLTFIVYDSMIDLIQNNDVVISCITYTDEQFAEDSCYLPGCTIIPVHTRGFQNCDLFFDKIFADDIGHVKGFKHFDKFKSVSETCDVITGRKPGRENDNERILVYNIGVSIHDIYFAGKIYPMITGAENSIDLGTPGDNIWV